MIYETAFDRLLFGPAAAITPRGFYVHGFLVVLVYQFFDKWISDEE
ncbi:hypothetical protein [Candidatus Villigracilis saccharophilus]|nr:hypothetical protein [Anaerolineales bacterium]